MWQTTKTLKQRFILRIDNDCKAVEISLSTLTLFFIISSSITMLNEWRQNNQIYTYLGEIFDCFEVQPFLFNNIEVLLVQRVTPLFFHSFLFLNLTKIELRKNKSINCLVTTLKTRD